MRFVHVALLALLLLALAACGTPTDNSVPADNSTGATGSHQTGASPAASAAGDPDLASPAASANPAGAGADPVERNNKYSAAPEMKIDQNKKYTATIETTKGTMKAELFPKEAPMAVNNFVFLARDNFYQNVKFHRIIKDFMVQTGDPTGTGMGGPGYRFAEEPVTREYQRGILAMAKTSEPSSTGSQFFIMHQDYPLPKEYTIFGKLTEGEDVLDVIANTPTTGSEGSTPTEDVRITNVTITEE